MKKFLIILLLLLTISTASAATREVDGVEYTTIAAAVAASSSGDIINIYPGNYNINLELPCSLTIQSSTGNPDDVVISATNPAAYVITQNGYDLILKDVTFRSDLSNYANVVFSNSNNDLTVEGCVFDFPYNSYNTAIYIQDGGGTGNVIIRNNEFSIYQAVYLYNYNYCYFGYNDVTIGDTNAFYDTSTLCENNTFHDCIGALDIETMEESITDVNVTITNNTFESISGDGVLTCAVSGLYIDNNTFDNVGYPLNFYGGVGNTIVKYNNVSNIPTDMYFIYYDSVTDSSGLYIYGNNINTDPSTVTDFIRLDECTDTDMTFNSPSSLTYYDSDGNEYTGTIGNYWISYSGTDANNDLIGDSAYNFFPSTSSTDSYPLMEQVYSYNPAPEEEEEEEPTETETETETEQTPDSNDDSDDAKAIIINPSNDDSDDEISSDSFINHWIPYIPNFIKDIINNIIPNNNDFTINKNNSDNTNDLTLKFMLDLNLFNTTDIMNLDGNETFVELTQTSLEKHPTNFLLTVVLLSLILISIGYYFIKK